MKTMAVNKNRPLVLFSITNGWGIRNFVHTGLFDAVSRFADIGVAASKDLLPFFQDMQERGRIVLSVELPSREPLLWQRVRQAKKAILQGKHGISTAKIKYYNKAGGPVGKICRVVLWSLLRMLAARWQIAALELLERRFAISYLLQLPMNPSVMVNCSPFDFRDNLLQRSLHGKGVSTIAIIPSWDNPSTKGCIPTDTDRVLVWGSSQKRELMSLYPAIDPSLIRISGIPQFDSYYRDLPEELTRVPFLKRLHIAGDRKVILYATCSERLFPTEPEVVEDVVRALVRSRFGNDAHLLIRCHPADRAERYAHLCSTGKVTIFPSSVRSAKTLYTWVPPEDEVDVLAATLMHCEVCVNTASTMTLDAFACEKPVVNVAYDGKHERPYIRSVRRFYDYQHYRPIAHSGAVLIAGSASELINSIERSLVSPQQLKSRREMVIKTFCHRPEGGGIAFIIREIEKLAR